MVFDGNFKRKSDRRAEDGAPDIAVSLSVIGQSLKNIEEVQERHSHILFGRDEGKGGLILEVDRLRIHKQDTEKRTFVVYATAIGLALKTIWDMLIRR